MKARRQIDGSDTDTLDLTPMLDVVFIMLIFFIVTAVFVRVPGVEVVRPAATTAVDVRNPSVLIAIDEESRIWIDKSEVDASDVRVVIERLRAENPKGSVVIQADGKAETGTAVRIMDEVRSAGAPVVTVATSQDR